MFSEGFFVYKIPKLSINHYALRIFYSKKNALFEGHFLLCFLL